MKSSVLVAAVGAAALVMGLAACTTPQGGTPTAGNSPSATGRPTLSGTGGSSSTRTTAPTGTSGGGSVASIDACALLTSAEQAALAVNTGKPKDGQSDVDKGCIWNSADQGKFTIRANAYGDVGLKDVQATGEVKSIPNIGKRKAIQFPYGPVCNIALELSPSSRVDVNATTGNDLNKACSIVLQAAQMVESKLPAGS